MAESSGDPVEQRGLFEQIGDLYLALGNTSAAREAYEAAVARCGVRMRSRTLRCWKRPWRPSAPMVAVRDSIETARRIADIVVEPKDRASRRREIAEFEMEQGNYERAADLLEQSIKDDPSDETALWNLSECYERAGRGADVCETLQRVLPQWPEPAAEPELARRRALLWSKLGGLLATSDPVGAVGALQAAITADPQRVEARLALAEIYGSHPEHTEMGYREPQGHLAFRPHPRRIVARSGCAPTCTTVTRIRLAACSSVLSVLGLASDEEHEFLSQHPSPERKPDDPYAATFEDGVRAQYLEPLPEWHFMGEVLATVWEGATGFGASQPG